MNILHIANFTKINGLYEAISNLAKAQQKIEGNRVIIIVGRGSELVDDDFILYIKNMKCFSSFIKEFTPDICIFHSMYEPVELFFPTILRKRGIPYIITYHGGASSDNAKRGWLKKKIANLLYFNSFVKKAYATVYLNQGEYNKSIFKKQDPFYYIIPNGISLPSKINSKNINTINITYISRIDIWGKGLDVLCDALRIVKESKYAKNIHFDFYGQSNGSYHIFDEFGDFAHYHGPVFGKDKEKAFNEANIFILPSRSEGMPMSVLEALSFGVPCIVTPQTNMADIIIKNKVGWVSELNKNLLADCIIKAVGEYTNAYNEYINRCIEVAKEYDWNKIANKQQTIYDKIVNSDT